MLLISFSNLDKKSTHTTIASHLACLCLLVPNTVLPGAVWPSPGFATGARTTNGSPSSPDPARDRARPPKLERQNFEPDLKVENEEGGDAEMKQGGGRKLSSVEGKGGDRAGS